MNATFEDEHARIRAGIQAITTFKDIDELDESVDTVADALMLRTTLLERELHRLQGAVLFRGLGAVSLEDLIQLPDSSEQ